MAENSPPQLIQSYGDGGFRIAGDPRRGSVIVFADRTVAWSAETFDDINEVSLAPVFATKSTVDLLLIGSGTQMKMVPAGLRAALREAGIAVEAMDTGAACRTFNVLLAEGRRVAAALIAIG